MAQAMLDIWQQMVGRLQPVIGARGVEALFARALHQACKAHPWLSDARRHDDSATALASLAGAFASHGPAQAAQASHLLLTTFTELLANLIGESLTESMLGAIWSRPPGTGPTRETST